MKKKNPKREQAVSSSSRQEDPAQDVAEDCSKALLRADARLAKRCLAGEVAAWETLYAQCHAPLCLSIRLMFGPQTSDSSLVDEIAARVWYAVVANDGELLSRYNSRRGARLVTFLRSLAKDEISRYFRAELRRRKRELVALRERPQHHGPGPDDSDDAMSEFLETLTPSERGFCNEHLLAEPPEGPAQAYSSASIWQFTRRVYHKLVRFLSRNP